MAVKRSISTYVITAFFIAVCGVIIIGGISIYMVNRMMYKTYTIEEESKNIDFINHIHNKTYNLMLAIQHFLIKPAKQYSMRATELIVEIEDDIAKYIKYEEKSPNPESQEEIRLLRLLNDNVEGIRGIVQIFDDFSVSGSFDMQKFIYLEKYAYNMETLINEINKLHFDIISRKVDKSRQRMFFVFSLYLVFSGLGIIAVYAGYRVHKDAIVTPVKRLAAATQQLSTGDLSVRVSSKSGSEIGILYKSFNSMAERLQAHEKQLIDFNQELEDRVKERTQELQEAYEKLKETQSEIIRLEKMAAVGQIAASVTHEIKTPLNSLYMNLQLLKKKLNDCAGDCEIPKREINRTADLVEREILRISDVLEEFVRYAKLAPLELKISDINKIVRDVADITSQKAEDAGVRLQLSPADNILPVMLDEKKMTQVLINLCINAIQSMPYGGELCIETFSGDDGIIIRVSDTGIGIPEGDMDKLFQPFFTTKEAGLGFGLAIVQKIVEAHGGQVIVESKEGEGSIFEIRLPHDIDK